MENCGIGAMLTQIEMKQSLSANEMRAALGGTVTVERALDPTATEFIPGQWGQVSEMVHIPMKFHENAHSNSSSAAGRQQR